MTGLGLDSWWDEPDYKRCVTIDLRGAFIISKLLQRDAAKMRTVMIDLYRAEQKDPQDITKFEWETILRFVGASPEEITDVREWGGEVRLDRRQQKRNLPRQAARRCR